MSAAAEATASPPEPSTHVGPAVCVSCAHPSAADANAALLKGESVRSVSMRLGISLPSLYRHVRSGHHRVRPQDASGAPDTDPTTLAPFDAEDQDAERLARAALRHLRLAMRSAEDKDRNGAITAARNALEHRAKIRGRLQGAATTVNVSTLTQVAVAQRAEAALMSAPDVTEQAGAWLHAQLEAGAPEAVRTVRELMRMLPGAEVAAGVALEQPEGDAPGEAGESEPSPGAAPTDAHASD